MITWKSLSGK